MKKSVITLLLVALLGISNTVSAQMKVNKFGYLNSLELLSLMPEVKPADEQIEKFATDLDAMLSKMGNEYNNKIVDYQTKKEKNLITGVEEEMVIKDITDLEKRIGDFQESAQQRISKKKEELYAPIMKKADDAIKAVAKENGFTYIFDSSYGNLLFAEDSDNIIELVCKKLGIKYTKPAETPAGK